MKSNTFEGRKYCKEDKYGGYVECANLTTKIFTLGEHGEKVAIFSCCKNRRDPKSFCFREVHKHWSEIDSIRIESPEHCVG